MIENKMAQLFPQKIKKRELFLVIHFTTNLLYCLHLFSSSSTMTHLVNTKLLLTKLVVAHHRTQALVG